MPGLQVDFDVQKLIDSLDDRGKRQLPFATALALSRTAYLASKQIGARMSDVFDEPTPLTRNAPLYTKATKETLFSDVFLRNEATKGTPPVKYLQPEVQAGGRRLKRFERALIAAGVMADGEFAMPGKGAKLNRYGNVSAGQIMKILSALRAQRDPLQNTSKDSVKRNPTQADIFATRSGDSLPLGVWQRYGPRPKITRGPRKGEAGRPSKVRPLLIFVRSATYTVRLPFRAMVEEAYKFNFPQEFAKAMKRAMATARR